MDKMLRSVAVSSAGNRSKTVGPSATTSASVSRCDSSKYSKLLRDLEGDSVDTEILDEELRFLKEREPKTCRGRTAQMLENGSPSLHIFVCGLILLDAGIVVAQILMDVHAMRCQYHHLATDLSEVTQFLKSNHIIDSDGDDVTSLLQRLRSSSSQLSSYLTSSSKTDNTLDSIVTVIPVRRRRRRASSTVTPFGDRSELTNRDDFRSIDADDGSASSRKIAIHCSVEATDVESMAGARDRDRRPVVHRHASSTLMTCSKLRRLMHTVFATAETEVACVVIGEPNEGDGRAVTGSVEFGGREDFEIYSTAADAVRYRRPTTPPIDEPTRKRLASSSSLAATGNGNIVVVDGRKHVKRSFARAARKIGEVFPAMDRFGGIIDDDDIGADWINAGYETANGFTTAAAGGDDEEVDQISSRSDSPRSTVGSGDVGDENINSTQQGSKCIYAGKMQKIAHVLHYCSVGILGLFVLQVFLKVYAMGADFFTKKIEIFDGAITAGSFAIDVVLMEGVSMVEGEETLALMVVFLLWRVLRLANGLVVASKQRQEFRISLQKRARQRAEKRAEWLEAEIDWREREIDKLASLCTEKGANEEEIAHCRVKHTFKRMNASEGLSSVASFSLGLSMSMRGAALSGSSEDGSGGGGNGGVSVNGSGIQQASNCQRVQNPNQPLPHYAHPALMRCLRPPAPPRKPSFQDLFPVIPQVTASAGSGSMSSAASRRRSSLTGFAAVGRRRSSCAAAVELIHRRRPNTLFGGSLGSVSGMIHRKLDHNSGSVVTSSSDVGRLPSTGWHFSAGGFVGAGRRRRRLSTIDERAREIMHRTKQAADTITEVEDDEENAGTPTENTESTSFLKVSPMVVEEFGTPPINSSKKFEFSDPCRLDSVADGKESIIGQHPVKIINVNNEIGQVSPSRDRSVSSDVVIVVSEDVQSCSPKSRYTRTSDSSLTSSSSDDTDVAVSFVESIDIEDVDQATQIQRHSNKSSPAPSDSIEIRFESISSPTFEASLTQNDAVPSPRKSAVRDGGSSRKTTGGVDRFSYSSIASRQLTGSVGRMCAMKLDSTAVVSSPLTSTRQVTKTRLARSVGDMAFDIKPSTCGSSVINSEQTAILIAHREFIVDLATTSPLSRATLTEYCPPDSTRIQSGTIDSSPSGLLVTTASILTSSRRSRSLDSVGFNSRLEQMGLVQTSSSTESSENITDKAPLFQR